MLSITGSTDAPTTTASVPKPKATGPSFGEVMDAFRKEARMTPQQRIRRDVLKEHRLTEEKLQAMSPAERKAIEDKLAPIIAKRVKAFEEEAQRRGKQIGLPSM